MKRLINNQNYYNIIYSSLNKGKGRKEKIENDVV